MEAALFQRPLSIGGIIVPIEYQSTILASKEGFLVDSSRSINVYLEVTSIATPSLLCTCDAYESNLRVGFPPFIANKLYTIIPE